MVDMKQLVQFMGGRAVVGSPNSEFEFIEVIRNGLPLEVIQRVVDSSLIAEEVIFKSLRMTNKSAAQGKTSTSRLKPSESELIYRFSKTLVAASEIFGDAVEAKEWMLTNNRALRGDRPIDLLDTGIGFDDVITVLSRIEHGVYS